MRVIDMKKYGLTNKDGSLLSNNQKFGRIISRDNENYKIVTQSGIYDAEVSNKLKYDAKTLSDYPVVGDFVIVEINQHFNSIIHGIEERKNTLVRKGKWDENYDHVVASNIDTIFICLSLNNDFNMQKLKAYISISDNCKAELILILSECDSFSNIDNILNQVKDFNTKINIIVTSMDTDSINTVKNYIKDGKTSVFIGPEHDKVKLISKVFEEIIFQYDLVLLPGGGIIINTPEMRELGIESLNTTRKFVDTLN